MAKIDKVEKGLKSDLRRTDDKVGAVRVDMEDLAKRVAMLEARPAGSSEGSTSSTDSRLPVVVGGWQRHTQGQLIEGNFKALVADLDVGKYMDQEWFVPGRGGDSAYSGS